MLLDVLFAAQGALFWVPVFVLFFSQTLGPDDILALEAVYYFSIVLLEVPSGWLSDRIGRRWTLVFSGLGWTLGALVIGLSTSFVPFAAGQVLLAGGRAFASGTDSSMVYETLHGLGRTETFRDRVGRAMSYSFGALAVSALVGGAMGAIDLRLPYFASVATGLVATGAALLLVEPPHEREGGRLVAQLGQLGDAVRDPVVRGVLVVVVAMTVFTHIPYELQQPWLSLTLDPATASTSSGLLVATGFAAASWGTRNVGRLAKWVDPHDAGLAFPRLVALSMVFLATVMAGMAAGPHLWVVPLLALRSLPTGLTVPLAENVLHPRLPDDIRATWLSVQSLSGRMVFAGVLFIASFGVGDEWTLQTLRAVLLPAVALAALGALLLGSRRR